MRVLITTQNKDKYKIICKLLQMSGWSNAIFESLESSGLGHVDVEEVGTIKDRARDKALFIKNNYSDTSNKFDFILGIDDGFEIKGKIEPEVKRILPFILDGILLEDGEIIYDCRAICLLKSDGSIVETILKLPFKYKNNLNGVEVKEKSYPLSNTLTPINSDIFISDLSESDQFEYYLKQCSVELDYLFNGVINAT